ncbi:MAG: BatA and WFA domain-containing protein [Planctomycetota bacterium]
MTWLPTLGPLGLAVAAAVPFGILALYFLKLRREPVEIPSTFLWSRTIEDLHVNSLLQRLRNSLLLLLQLLVALLAIVALLRPGIRGNRTLEDRRVFLVDRSASMSAIDGDDGRTRLDLVREDVLSRIEQMQDGETAMVVAFDQAAETVQSFTSDRRRLRTAVQSIEATNRRTDILGALRAADGLANPRRSSQVGDLNDVQVAEAKPAELQIHSDGGFDPVNEFNLGNLVPMYVPAGQANGRNLAITAMMAGRGMDDGQRVEVFATVANLGTEPATSDVSLLVDGELADAASVDLEPDEQTGLTFELQREDAVTLELRLDETDNLAIDNASYAAMAPLRLVDVLLVTPGNIPLETGLKTTEASSVSNLVMADPSFLDSDGYALDAAAGTYDLIIYDRCSPKEMPSSHTFFIAAIPPKPPLDVSAQDDAPEDAETERESEQASDETSREESNVAIEIRQAKQWGYSSDLSSMQIIDINRTHPIMRYLDLYNLLVYQGRALESPDGGDDLITADIGSVMTIAPRDGFQDLVLGFELVGTSDKGESTINTNWYAERSWPVFLLNSLRHLAGAAQSGGAASYPPGSSVRFRVDAGTKPVEVFLNGEALATATPSPGGLVEVTDTEQLGIYEARREDRILYRFCVNLFDPLESRIAAAKSVEVGYKEVNATNDEVESRREYWRLLLVAALGLLATEWWVYSKRVA